MWFANAVGNPVDALYRIMDNRVEVVEFAANQNTKYLTPLKLNIIEGVLVAAIVRHNEIIIPHGNDKIKERDNIILIAKDKSGRFK